jgi:hypothetical protein
MKSYLTVMTDHKKLLGRWCLVFFIVLFLILLGFLNPLKGQNWAQYTIEDNSQECAWVRMGDMDGDEDMDVVAIARGELMEIVWYEAPSWNKHVIDGDVCGAWSLAIANMDSDDDLDVVCALSDCGTLVWYESPSWEEHLITEELPGAMDIQVVDMNGDDTLDVVVSGFEANRVVWYEGPDWDSHLIADNIGYPTGMRVADIDGDDTLDVVCASMETNSVVWYEGPAWTSHIIDSNLPGAGWLDVGDVNNDGNPDVVCTGMLESVYGSLVCYMGPSWTKMIIDDKLVWPYGLKIADINGDPYPDIICAAEISNELNWYAGPAMTKNTITADLYHPLSVDVGDMDGDEDEDVVATTFEPGEIFWYENTLPNVLNVPADFPTIQAAIDAAVDGDVVLVEDNTYYENINFKGKAITVTSRLYVDDDTSHVSNTIIDGSQSEDPDSGSVVYFISGEDTNSVLSGFTITGGSGTKGSWQGEVYFEGGGIYCPSGGKILDNIIRNNAINVEVFVASGAGILAGWVGNEHVHIEGNTILSNSVINNRTAGGGGITIYSNGNITDNTLIENMVTSSDGVAFGGGIKCVGYSGMILSVDICNNRIENNQVNANGMISEGYGGGIDYAYSNGKISNNDIYNNSIRSNGDAFGGGIFINRSVRSTISNNRISSNRVEGNGINVRGGGMNYGSHGVEGKTSIYNNIIIYNKAINGDGGGISFGSYLNRDVSLINNTIAYNEADNYGGGIFTRDNTVGMMFNSILWGNKASSYPQIYPDDGSTLWISYSDVQDGNTDDNNINSNPKFNDTISFNLSDTSLCISAGTDSIYYVSEWYYAPNKCIHDLDRPTPPGTNPDLGACENPLGVSSIPEDVFFVPKNFELSQNYPNPFNPLTMINYQLPMINDVDISIYNLLGQKVVTLVNGRQQAGRHQVEWDASGFASGVYYYRIEAGEFVDVKKMILLR